jgi:5-methylthioadenosine/S-adenosylhomocysteine deaminase
MQLKSSYPDYEIIDGKDSLVLPGLINCHTHAAMTLLRGYADDMLLMDWLSHKIWPREAFLTENDIYWGTQLAILEMIKSGTTCFADMYFFMDTVAKVAAQSGIRAVLSRGMIGFGNNAELAMEETEELVNSWHGKAEGRITCMLGPHAPYTCPPEYLHKVMKLADKLKVGLHIHLAETITEVNDIKKQYEMTPVKLMDSIGLFDKRHVLAAHCVHLSDEEINILVEKGVGIAHNPESNMKLASGIAPLPQLLEKGGLVGLGTDGASSNNNLDMIEEMRTCALLHKVNHSNPTILPAHQVLELATIKGASALGLKMLGTIKPGYKADLIMIDLLKPHLIPLHNPVANLVYSAHSSDVKTVIIDGKLVMKDKELLTLDEEKILYQAQIVAKNLAER